eukprot:3907266-Pyramimonas_sp.AAC.1
MSLMRSASPVTTGCVKVASPVTAWCLMGPSPVTTVCVPILRLVTTGCHDSVSSSSSSLRMCSLRYLGGIHRRSCGSRDNFEDGSFARRDQLIVEYVVESLRDGSGVNPARSRPFANNNIS